MKTNSSILSSKASAKNCIRCGTCCKKGGPCFHIDDKFLIETGKIPAKYLYTIRKGERVFDNIKGVFIRASQDIIKIKGTNGSRACCFYDPGAGECKIYDIRPKECRILKCWDTREIEKLYDQNRLTRKDLLENVDGLWDIIRDHHKRCDYMIIENLTASILGDEKEKSFKKLREIIQYDMEIRSLVKKQSKTEDDMTEFLFGRPLVATIDTFGIRIRKKEDKFIMGLKPLPKQRGIRC